MYIGSAVDFYRRWRRHHNELTRKVHSNQHLQRAWDKYGTDSFIWTVIEETKPAREVLLSREQYWLDRLRDEGAELYNTCITAGSHLGVKRSEKTKKLMSQIAQKRGDNGMVRDKEWRKQISEANKSNVKTRCGAEMRKKVSIAHSGKRWVTRSGVNKQINPDDLQTSLSGGWCLGFVRH